MKRENESGKEKNDLIKKSDRKLFIAPQMDYACKS
jgi:hypothetical protein